jgi:hydrogenase nickel incorporation protein HypA/HybF
MHEMGIVMEVIRIVEASIPSDKSGADVERINLKIGKLSAVVSDSLRFCFEVATRKTPLEGAQLVIDEIPVTALCNDCRHQWTIENPVFICPACNARNIEMLTGRELDIESIEIREGDQEHVDGTE